MEDRDTSTSDYHYPFASAPDIIRSNQKDVYVQSVLHEHIISLLRHARGGARFTQTHAASLRTLSDLFYFSLTTLIGNRTLGEEYTDIVQVRDTSLRLPSLVRRATYILTTVLLPSLLGRLLPKLRRRLRAKLASNLRRAESIAKDKEDKSPSPSASSSSSPPSQQSISSRIQTYLLTHLDDITSPSPLYALSLATFYFTGSYYHLGKRLAGIRYIFTKRLSPSESRAGYEVLGVLLVIQMSVQAYLHLHRNLSVSSSTSASATTTPRPPHPTDPGSVPLSAPAVDSGVEVAVEPPTYTAQNSLLFGAGSKAGQSAEQKQRARLAEISNTPLTGPNDAEDGGSDGVKPRYDLHDAKTMTWIPEGKQRKCTLCLEEMSDPSATTCGHVFCWRCISDWCAEKPECPLCRQVALPQHILPLRS
ncbi:MAG: hypothetical protein M1825_000149 [Sarcosagium campestre]|nr:MAG: hypothetical protein M1825_000149 [Sarcosagium campestre]